MLAGKTKKVATIEEMNEAAADGWAGSGQDGPKCGEEVKVAVDTNVLVRAAVRDDPEQTDAGDPNHGPSGDRWRSRVSCLCEFVWVLRSVYGYRAPRIAEAIRILLEAENVETNRPAVEAGLAMLEAGGDFADGVIAYEGKWLGAETFVSFDKKAVEMLRELGVAARSL